MRQKEKRRDLFCTHEVPSSQSRIWESTERDVSALRTPRSKCPSAECPGGQRLGPWAHGCLGNRPAVCQVQCTCLARASEHPLMSPSYRWGARGPRRLGHSPQVSQSPRVWGPPGPRSSLRNSTLFNKCPGNESRERPCWKPYGSHLTRLHALSS